MNVPAARIAERTGKKPSVVGTFVAFALFPLAVVAARSFGRLLLAFVAGGLRKVGEPAAAAGARASRLARLPNERAAIDRRASRRPSAATDASRSGARQAPAEG